MKRLFNVLNSNIMVALVLAHLAQNTAQGAVNGSVALAYEIQTTAVARNPTWTFSSSPCASAAMIAGFKHQ